jgi:type III restriction enzyme
MSDFSLMDAIECGIVKLPRVPVAENIPGDEMPMFRNLWEHIGKEMPKKGRGKGGQLDPLKLPTRCRPRLQALYGHYEKTFELWERRGIKVPPCFIVVCNNTAISKLVYDYISGFHRQREDGSSALENGRLPLFRNFDEHGNPLAAPEHPAHRQRAARSRRRARRQLPRHGRRRDRALPPRDRRAHRRRARRPTTSPTRNCCAR